VSPARSISNSARLPGKKAETIASFVNDHYVGLATTAESDGQCEISVTVHMPIQLNLLLSVSGFMGCLAQLFELEYDGWCCERTFAENSLATFVG
jgi:hypothetical protein